ncbi:MAG: MotA/TolQ/ExbB proton channel family protein [Verrucomicrobia bacterium]|nr:MAG: MotA/TolQ/ExbB proton channel family protein [Verrucomicrobiota bacterium]
MTTSPTLLSQAAHFFLDPNHGAPTGSILDVVVRGGWVMLPLLFLSMITLALILVYLVTLRGGSVVSLKYMRMAETLLRKGDLLGFLSASNHHTESVALIMNRTIDFITRNPQATLAQAREIAQTEGTREANNFLQKILWLSDIATISPMLGLLGTVFGMIRSFNVMANDVAASRPMLLAGGVGQALIATAAGLVIGILAMAAYAFFRSRVHCMIADMESATTQLLTLLPKTEEKKCTQE